MVYNNWKLEELYEDEKQANDKIIELFKKYNEIADCKNNNGNLRIREIFIPEINRLALYFTLLKNNNKYINYEVVISEIDDLYLKVMKFDDIKNEADSEERVQDIVVAFRREIVEKYVLSIQKDLDEEDIFSLCFEMRNGNRMKRREKYYYLKEKLAVNKGEYYTLMALFIYNRKMNNSINKCTNIFSIKNKYYEAYSTMKKNQKEIISSYISILERKRRILKLDELEMYDIQYELVGNGQRIEYGAAKSIIENATRVLGLEYRKTVKESFEKNWINAIKDTQKEEGAFCYYVKGFHPYITIQYNDSVESVMELAHEIGHAIKYFYGKKKENAIVREIPAVLNELLILDYLEKTLGNKNLFNLYMKENVCKQIIDMLYEMEFFERIYNMEFNKMSMEEVQNISKDLDKKYYGKAVKKVDTDSWLVRNLLYKNFEDRIMYALACIYAVCIKENMDNLRELYLKYLEDEVSIYELCGCDDEHILSENMVHQFCKNIKC